MVIICPYCDIEINEKLVEAEDGCCPECGTLITAGSIVDDENESDDIYENEFGDEDLNDEFGDEDYEEDIDFEDEDFEEEVKDKKRK